MAAFQKFEKFTSDLLEGVHGDLRSGASSLKFALTLTTPSASLDAVLADLPAEIVYTNVSTISGSGAAGRVLQNVVVTDAAGVATLDMDSMTITAITGAIPDFQFLSLYNDTPTNKNLIGFIDYGSVLSLALAESVVVDFNVLGLFTVT